MEIATGVWVAALIRRAQLAGASAVVAARGDDRAGAVLVRTWNTLERQARLYRLDPGGAWAEPHPAAGESELDAYAERQRRYDGDLWVVEIEDREGRAFLTEPFARPDGGEPFARPDADRND